MYGQFIFKIPKTAADIFAIFLQQTQFPGPLLTYPGLPARIDSGKIHHLGNKTHVHYRRMEKRSQ